MIPHSRPWLTHDDTEQVVACLQSGMINEGVLSARLEALFAQRFGGIAVATGSGSQGLLLALTGLGVEGGGEVLLPTYVCPEVLAVVETLGARAVLIDCGDDWLLDMEQAAGLVTSATRAVVLPYTMGIAPADDPRALGIPVVEDLAPWFGDGAAPRGDVQVFSFEATKMLAAGEGGMVVARDPALATRIAAQKRIDGSPYKRNLYPLSDLQAALALSQFSRVDQALARRTALAARYLDGLAGCAARLPTLLADRSAFFRFPLLLPAEMDLDAVVAAFAAEGVAVRRPVDRLLHQLRPAGRRFPVAESLHARTLSIPLYPAMTDSDADCVIAAARTVLG
jgi:UDP-4-amino-4-deoxy-L-arabinose-oxoglutarate aminotransferase